MRKWAPAAPAGCGSLPATLANLDRVITLYAAPDRSVWSWVWAPRCGSGFSPGCRQCGRVAQVRWLAELMDDVPGQTGYWIEWAKRQLTV